MSSMKNLDDTFNFGDQFLYDKPTEDDQEKSKVREESDSTIPDPSHQTVTSTPPVIAPFIDVSSSKPSLLVTPPPINTEATTITTSLPEITPFIALQLRVARLEQEISEVKKTDHSADVLMPHSEFVLLFKDGGGDTDNAHIPKVSTTTWFKPIPEGERTATPEPEWTIPPNDVPKPENNWANTYATTYQVPTENRLQRKTYDIGSLIKWFCRRTGKKKLCKADLEGPTFNLVKAFP
ncbi:hypothetical protein Tco_1122633 [Tanacetum coccineum]|uniref:Uncharacterized protein n=1 Tax=Tanacetum coccineum TaxID=301880 RepID=A0ABQ5J138_9ASTR